MTEETLKIIQQNSSRMKEMETKFGDKYLELFGTLVLNGCEIQEAINKCYKILIEK